MGNWLQDIRYSIRSLVRNPGFTLAVLLILALGMGPNTVIFSVLDAVLFRPGPYKDAEELLVIHEANEETRSIEAVSYPNFEDWRRTARSFSAMAAYRSDFINLKDTESVERVSASSVSADFFPVLGIEPILGRTLGSEDFHPGESRAVVLSHGYWQRRFGGRQDIIGTKVVVDGNPGEVIGVMPRNFRSFSLHGRGARVWVPLSGRSEQEDRATPFVEVVARPKSGIAFDQARSEMETIAVDLAARYPVTNIGHGVRLRTIREIWMGTVGPGPRILAFLVLCVLLVACANVANVILAKGISRKREMALRRALGAGRFRLIRQLLTESVVLGLVGGAGGLVFAFWGLDLVNRFSGGIFLGLGIESFELDRRSLGFSITIGALTGIVFGLIPAIRTSNVSLNQALKERGAVIGGSRKSRLAGVLVVSELVVATLLLTVVSLYVATSLHAFSLARDPGFRIGGILTAELAVSEQRFQTSAERAGFYAQVADAMGEVPGVMAVGLVSSLPGGYSPGRAKVTRGLVDSSLPLEETPGKWVDYRVVSPGYFETLGISVMRGRSFSDFDNEKAPRVAMINQRAAVNEWSEQDPVGETISINGVPHTIIGVVSNVQTALAASDRQDQEVCVSYLQECPTSLRAVVFSERSAESLTPAIKAAVAAIGPNEAASGFQTMEQYLDEVMVGNRFLIGLMGSFALLAALIASAGVYGIMSHFVSQRVPELGIRMALGAGKGEVLRHIMRQGAALVVIGVGIGFILSVVLAKFLPTVMFGLVVARPIVYGSVTLFMAAVGLVACYLPARRAGRIDPLTALRYE
jgi:putative ABC transport system permease protein